ncbi:MAG: FAD-binding oxidoreductase [Alphaproteobacteria bacterium]|jgi:D-amino-acid dehydrogenase
MGKSIIVVGGGIVGVCNALSLQRAGHSVTLIDRKAPGRETSYGNAGVLSESSVMVLNNPSMLRALPRLLAGRSLGLRYSLSFVLKNLGWFIKFLSYCTPRHARAAGRALRDLQLSSLAQHKAWIAEAGVGHLLRHAAWVKAFRSEASFAKYSAELALLDEMGVNYTIYDREQIRQMEPGLKPVYAKAVVMDDTCGVSSPANLTDAYVGLFEAAGGTVMMGDVSALEQDAAGWKVTVDGSAKGADHVIIAAGPWSSEVAGWLGYRIPLAWERGYHLHLKPGDGPQLGRAICDMDGGFAIVPTLQGVRITSGVEIAERDAPKNPAQIIGSVASAREAHDMKEVIEDEPWMGRRPTLVDSLPMIGPAPRHPGLWFNFGHQHLGLSMAPGSALSITAMIDNQPAPFDATPFRPTRFAI